MSFRKLRLVLALMFLSIPGLAATLPGQGSARYGESTIFNSFWSRMATSLRYQLDIPRFDANAFRDGPVTNPLFPLKPGTAYVFQVREGNEVSVDSITVTPDTKVIAGVRAVVVHDRVRRHGKLTEDTYDWYAQDTAGNVWYLGEDTRAYKFRRFFSRSGSWQAGARGAQPGIIMLGHPRVGAVYRQEYRKGIAEDMGRVISVDDTVTVPAGRFARCLTTEDWSPLEPGVRERKTYCPGIGVVREEIVQGGNERTELVAMRRP